jgi:hypothetical protein
MTAAMIASRPSRNDFGDVDDGTIQASFSSSYGIARDIYIHTPLWIGPSCSAVMVYECSSTQPFSAGGVLGKATGEAENLRGHHEIGREIGQEIGQGDFFEIRLCKSVSLHCISR